MDEKSQNSLSKKPVVSLEGVYKSFANQVILQDISFQLTAGQSLCICGPNAAGKTTLLRIIGGLLIATEGKVEICGFNVKTQPQKTRAMIGAIFHKSMVYPQLTVIENLQFFARLYGLKDNKLHIQKLMEQTQLMPYRYDKVAILSRGMLQRLAITRALVHNPSVLLADEPFAGLDAHATKHLVTILRSFKNRSRTVVMTTHNANFALQCCEQVAVLDNKKLIFNKKVSEINITKFAQDYLWYARENN